MGAKLGRIAGLGLLFLLLTSMAQAAVARQTAPPSLSIDDYWLLLQDTQALVNRLAETSQGADTGHLLAAAEEWERVTAVRLPNGDLIPLDPSYLVAQLRAENPDLNQLDELLTTQLKMREVWPQSIHSGEDIESLNQILARPEFQWPETRPSPFQQGLARLWERWQEFLWRLWPEGDGATTINGRIFNILAALALALVLFFALRDLAFDFVADANISGVGLVEDETLTAESALNRAQNLSQIGDYRTAVRYLYLSTLLILEERGLLRYDRSRTNREYLRSVAQQPELAAILRDVIDVFDRVWYGFQPLDEAAYAHYADQVEDLQRQK
ncbi:MAG: DUF4129 domain-containing protein [Chloroflexi bacterium]|nr:DUF4129 domain-containing protein [Chloroflexota bacterium]